MMKASKFEIFIYSLLPYALVLIVAITVAEIAFSRVVQPYNWLIDVIDLWIIWVFIMDLLFKFKHAKSIPEFLKHYWPYIIAVFPFFLVLRVVERFYQISTISSGSTIILGRYVASLLNEARLARFAEVFRFLGFSTRFIRAVYFYENPKIRHKINAIKVLKLKGKKR